MSAWTAEQDAMLTQLWADGLSARVIAGKIPGDATRCAVLGRVHRLHLPRRRSRQASRLAPLKTERPTYIRLNKTATELIELPPDQSECAVTFAELRERHCRFPLGDPKDEAFRFCGAVHETNSSYCYRHHRLCHTSAGRQWSDAERMLASARAKRELNLQGATL